VKPGGSEGGERVPRERFGPLAQGKGSYLAVGGEKKKRLGHWLGTNFWVGRRTRKGWAGVAGSAGVRRSRSKKPYKNHFGKKKTKKSTPESPPHTRGEGGEMKKSNPQVICRTKHRVCKSLKTVKLPVPRIPMIRQEPRRNKTKGQHRKFRPDATMD